MSAGTDRTSAFVAGETLPEESFGAGEGMVLFAGGLVLIAAAFVVLHLVGRLSRANRRRLDGVASALGAGGGDDA